MFGQKWVQLWEILCRIYDTFRLENEDFELLVNNEGARGVLVRTTIWNIWTIWTFLLMRAFGEEPEYWKPWHIIRESSHNFVANAFRWALCRHVLDICIHWHNYVEQVCAHSGPMLCALLPVCVPFMQHLVNMKQHYHLLSNLNVGRGWWERSNTFIYGRTRCFIIYFICYVCIFEWRWQQQPVSLNTRKNCVIFQLDDENKWMAWLKIVAIRVARMHNCPATSTTRTTSMQWNFSRITSANQWNVNFYLDKRRADCAHWE